MLRGEKTFIYFHVYKGPSTPAVATPVFERIKCNLGIVNSPNGQPACLRRCGLRVTCTKPPARSCADENRDRDSCGVSLARWRGREIAIAAKLPDRTVRGLWCTLDQRIIELHCPPKRCTRNKHGMLSRTKIPTKTRALCECAQLRRPSYAARALSLAHYLPLIFVPRLDMEIAAGHSMPYSTACRE